MNTSPVKDFGPISDDYAFFEEHSTEAREDVAVHADVARRRVPKEGTLRMLDLGCGSGTVTARFLEKTGWPASRLQLTLVEPVESARRQAVMRVAEFSQAPVIDSATVPRHGDRRFDVILANHVLYYVPDLTEQIAILIGTLTDSGLLTTAIADRRNALIELWIAGFELLGMEVPYHTSEDVEAALQVLGVNYEKQRVPYELAFADTVENRMRILRFLFADYLGRMPRHSLLDRFDPYRHSDRIRIRTSSDHFVTK